MSVQCLATFRSTYLFKGRATARVCRVGDATTEPVCRLRRWCVEYADRTRGAVRGSQLHVVNDGKKGGLRVRLSPGAALTRQEWGREQRYGHRCQ